MILPLFDMPIIQSEVAFLTLEESCEVSLTLVIKDWLDKISIPCKKNIVKMLVIHNNF